MSDSNNTIQENIKILRSTLINDTDLYNAFVASILSALKELPKESYIEDVASAIADRIIGKE